MKKDRVGEVSFNKFNSKMKIIEYNGSGDILVEFDNKYIKKTTYQNFKKGEVKSPYDKTLYEIGYIGEGKYGTKTKEYIVWSNMFQRCYSKDKHKINPTYKDCVVCEEWHNFQNFAQWYNENYYNCDEKLHLDKDLLGKDCRIYSPETCIFIPASINLAISNNYTNNTTGKTGVTYIETKRKYMARIVRFGKECYLGLFEDIETAYKIYKDAREEYLVDLINTYKHKIPDIIFNKIKKNINRTTRRK